MTIGTPLMWALFVGFVLVALAVDFFAMEKQGAHRVTMREAAIWSLIWVAVSFVFVAWLWWHLGGLDGNPLADAKALEFVTGYLVEKALAVDNIFVFLLVFTYFAVPVEYQKRVLMFGILGALVLRAIMILIGAWLIAQFHWILYFFGAFLVFTGVKMWVATGQEPDLEANPALQWIRRHMLISPAYDGEKFFTMRDGVRQATPLFVVILLIGIVDVVFAVDSIPAIFAITMDPFIVLTSNVFAILGLRAMYFMLAGMHERFHLLSYGLAIVLVFIGTKMLLVDIYKIPVSWSLGFTVVVLALTMTLSLKIPPRKGAAQSAYPFAAKKDEEPQPRDKVSSAQVLLRALDPVPVTELEKADTRSVTGTGSSALAASQAGRSQASDPGPFPERVSAFPSSGNGPGSDAPATGRLRTCAEPS